MNPTLHRPDHAFPPHARRLLGTITGIVRYLLWYVPDRTDPDLYYATTVEADLEPVTGAKSGSLEAGGSGLTQRAAFMSAIGEAAERYSLYLPDTSRSIEATYQDLADESQVIPTKYLSIYDPSAIEPTRLTPFETTRPTTWYPTINLLSGEQLFVPAQFVWLGGLSTEDLFYPTTSNGAACGTSAFHALRGGLTEYIERDAMMRAWYSQTPTHPIDTESLPNISDLISQRFSTDMFELRCFEVPSPIGIPAVGCAIVNLQDQLPKVAIGGAFALDRTTAYQSALIEAAQTWAYVKDLAAAGIDAASIDASHIYDLTDNLRYYSLPTNYPKLKTFLGPGPPQASQLSDNSMDDETAVRSLLDFCRKADATPLAIDVTPPDIRDVGFTVVRVIIPELVPLALPSLPPTRHPAFDGTSLTSTPHPYP